MDAGKFIRVLYEAPNLSLEDAAARFLELRKRTCPFPVLGSKIKKIVCIPTYVTVIKEFTHTHQFDLGLTHINLD